MEPPVAGGTPTPKPSGTPGLPDTASQLPTAGDVSESTAFAVLLAAVFLGSLGTLAFASVCRRRR